MSSSACSLHSRCVAELQVSTHNWHFPILQVFSTLVDLLSKKILLMGFFIRRFSSTSVSSVFPSYCLRVLYLSLFFSPLTVLLSVCPPRGANPLDHRDNSFSRSRSSSVTSIDKEARESISSFHFSDTYARKGDCTMTPCLYVGTSLGTVLALAIMMPPAGEQRQLQPVIISPTGGYPREKETK